MVKNESSSIPLLACACPNKGWVCFMNNMCAVGNDEVHNDKNNGYRDIYIADPLHHLPKVFVVRRCIHAFSTLAPRPGQPLLQRACQKVWE